MIETNYIEVTDLDCYKRSFKLTNEIGKLVITWGNFERQTVGSQLVRAVDSISANIAEGYGRYGKKDKIRFYRIAFGSCMEAKDWIRKVKERKLFIENEASEILNQLDDISRSINSFIKLTDEKLKY